MTPGISNQAENQQEAHSWTRTARSRLPWLSLQQGHLFAVFGPYLCAEPALVDTLEAPARASAVRQWEPGVQDPNMPEPVTEEPERAGVEDPEGDQESKAQEPDQKTAQNLVVLQTGMM